MGAFLAEFDDGCGFAVVEGLGVFGLEHVDDCVDEGEEGHAGQAGDLFSVVEELVDGLDAGALHVFVGLGAGEGLGEGL